MKLFAVVLGALALLAGFTGGVRAYSVSAEAGPAPVTPVAAPHYPKAQTVRPGVVFRYAPCRPPAHRVGKACVTTVTRTVTVAAPAAAPQAASAASTPAVRTVQHVRHTTGPAPRPGGEDGGHEGGGDGGGDGGGGGDD